MYLGLHNPDHYLMLIICYPSKYNLKCLFADGSSEISFIIAISTLMQLYTTSAMTQPARRTFLPGHVVVIICSLIIQTLNLARTVHLEHNTRTSLKIAIFAYLGLLLLSYPLLGYIADVCLTRYRTLKCSFIFLIVGCTIGLLTASSNTILKVFNTKQSISENASIVGISIIGILITTGVGLFEANALQFGLDQLLEAPTLKLISFIHWYYWTHNVVQLVAMYLMTSSLVIDSSINHLPQHEGLFIKNALVFTVVAILGLAAVGSLVLLHKSKRHLYILRAGLNPFKNIYKVLKYSWNHKVPEHRSAFTYWEEDVPRRIDLGKNKYGGPFTNEEVEDTKTFLRILPLLLCLFGYHLAGDGYSAPDQLQRTSCPSLPVLLLFVHNPLHMSTLVVVVGIPLYRLIINKCSRYIKKVRMLNKMWMGLYLSLVQVVFYIIVVINHDSKYWSQHKSVDCIINTDQFFKYSPGIACLKIRLQLFYASCETLIDNPVDNIYLWFIIPQLLNGLSSLLVSMTVFEFICAQAPRTTQGLLIGLWYATFSIRYLLVGLVDAFLFERTSWLIFEGVNVFLILVSLVLFSSVSRHYRYRQRDEIVNVQGMIEDTHEKWFDQEEEYMQERRAILSGLTRTVK